MTEQNDLIKERYKKLETLKGMGVNPFGGKFLKDFSIGQIPPIFEDKKRVRTAGRLTAMRVMGKSTFCDLKDDTGRIQLYVKPDHVSETEFKIFQNLDSHRFTDFIFWN